MIERKYVTVSMNIKQGEVVLAMLSSAIEMDAAKWTNACRRRADGVARALSAVLADAKKHNSKGPRNG